MQLGLFRQRIVFDGDHATVLDQIPGTTLALVRFDGERHWGVADGSYEGTEVLVDLNEADP